MNFRRYNCALCGRKSIMRFVHGRLVEEHRRKVRLCMIDCRHCREGVMAFGNNKEAAKAEAVRRWNAKQARDLVAMVRFLKKIFAGGDTE